MRAPAASLTKNNMIKKIALLAFVAALLSGCAIHQTVKPVTDLRDAEICLISNPGTRPGFAASLKRALEQKGFQVKQLPLDAALNQCPLMATYEAHWRWDLAMYMNFASIKVYRETKPSGEAIYDSRRGGANMNKFIDADKKVVELVNQLFPGGPPRT